ncbi:MAG: EamA family transporter [Spirochaetota bacterium]
MKQQKTAIIRVLLAAVLFGASAPLIKLVLDNVQPVQMASLLYLGSAAGLFFFVAIKRAITGVSGKEADLAGRDIPWLFGAAVSGGVVAPVVLLTCLRIVPASTASLLFNFEAAATALIAAAVFRESTGRRVWIAIVLITAASVLLSVNTKESYNFSLGAAGILAACGLWGLDNNLTRHISSKDPVTIVMNKSIIAGTFTLILSLVMGYAMPAMTDVLLSLIIGLCCYGISIVFFVQAMRSMGAARTGAYFALAPFIGAALSFAVFREQPGMFFLISLPFLILGAFILFGEKHSHLHTHYETEHEHIHSHDDMHHNHRHSGSEYNTEHSHLHRHENLAHAHAHMPDIHHRHVHEDEK